MGISSVAAIASAAITAGGAILSSNNASDATQNASNAQVAQNDKALALQKQQFDTTQAEFAPWRTVGAGALQMLARTMGIRVPADTFSYYNLPSANSNTPQPTPTGSTAPPASQAGQPDWDAYLAANPDVMAWAKSGHGDPNTPIEQQTLEQRAAYQFHNTGQSEGRALPTIPVSATNPAAPPANNTLTTAATSGPQAFDANGLPITNTPGKPTGLPTGPTSSTAPPGSDPRYGDFYASPDYQFRKDQGAATVTGNYAAKGLMDSGALGKGLIDYGQKTASDEFGNWYNRIASLAGVGQTAVGSSTTAGQANVNAQSGIIQNTGSSQASSIATQGGINSGLISSLGGTASGLINNLATSGGSGGSPIPLQTAPQSLGITMPAVNSNVPGLVTAPSELFG